MITVMITMGVYDVICPIMRNHNNNIPIIISYNGYDYNDNHAPYKKPQSSLDILFVHSFLHSFINSFIYTYAHTYIRTFIHAFIHAYILMSTSVNVTISCMKNTPIIKSNDHMKHVQ